MDNEININDSELRTEGLYLSFWKNNNFFAVWYDEPNSWIVYELEHLKDKTQTIAKYRN